MSKEKPPYWLLKIHVLRMEMPNKLLLFSGRWWTEGKRRTCWTSWTCCRFIVMLVFLVCSKLPSQYSSYITVTLNLRCCNTYYINIYLYQSSPSFILQPVFFFSRALLVKEDSLALLDLSDHQAGQALKDPRDLLERKVFLWVFFKFYLLLHN